ncbi:DUF3017 domain-containing protein [Streptomyces albidoflavus]|uniref:DUF3017 domain-containing protein n=1 Tax=Streptomyces albidoflavus TaxID=1886 RepID=UPI000FF67787|nr:DUF3017 domain-containing protein [Streptomyces albidoflavus]QPA01026.1 hypothetical protein DI273_20235 [Streptomyces violascens]RWZ73665.1 DUF3017 domain-containing protein [Streptomyces albidoflavus]
MSTDAPDDRPPAEQTSQAPEPRPEPAGGAGRAGAGVRTGVAKLGWTRREPGSRRFPRITRSIARPEGGGRAAAGDAPAPARQWPMLLVLSLVGLGLLLTALDVKPVRLWLGPLLIGVALLVGAGLRWWLPSVGMLAVRSRFTDLVTYTVLGVVIVVLALMQQPSPWLELPFLDRTLHFTVD